ncbi:hypothetical protein DL93DRAFT_2080518 [Clavulina sp. PMI_390]|nr:hypothetical protein DL93DRAFT_2080518 [Clavulina sp. PMI_390]
MLGSSKAPVAFPFQAELHSLFVEARSGHLVCSKDDETWIRERLRVQGGHFHVEQTLMALSRDSRHGGGGRWATLKNVPFLVDKEGGDDDDDMELGMEMRFHVDPFASSDEEEDDADPEADVTGSNPGDDEDDDRSSEVAGPESASGGQNQPVVGSSESRISEYDEASAAAGADNDDDEDGIDGRVLE